METTASEPPAERSSGSVPPTTVFRYRWSNPLDAIFAPRSIAVIGATEKAGSVGRKLLWNLVSHPFGGTVFPVNPRRASVLGIKAYPNLAALPEQVDLALIATPAPTVPGIIAECVEAGVKGAIILSAGFKENGEVGAELEQRILVSASREAAYHWAQLPWCNEPADRPQRYLRRLHGPTRLRRLHQPERCPLLRCAGLEFG